MNPNTPPTDPRHDSEGAGAQRASDHDPSFAGNDRGNPYYASHYGDSQPDLDTNAPLLKSNDLQRLNRKALLFLAGIIALLIIVAIWLVSRASTDDKPVKPREETVVIPELPRDASSAADTAPPIEVTEYPPPGVEEMPPLPMEETRPPSYASDYSASSSAPSPPRELTLRERRMNNMGDNQAAPGGVDPIVQAALAGFPPNQAASAETDKIAASDEASSAQFVSNPDGLLVRGTYLRCVLETRIITDVPGFTSCIVTEPTYSINGRRLLLPKGSKIYGKYRSTDPEQPRISVIWDRITTPNGIDVSMASPGVDNLGSAGYRGDYNAHWASRITSALMISLISDVFKYAGAEHGPRNTTISNGIITQTPYESNTARTMERLANQALDRTARRPATVTINQGTIVSVYVAKDVDFSAVLARN